jgi:hypothetical protein
MSYIEPGKEAIRIKRGADFSFGPFEIEIDGVILNLTGATCYCQLRESQKRDSALIADITLVVTTGAVTGYLSDIELTLTDTQTAAITQSGGYYDVLVVNSVGNDTYYLEGKVTVFGSVTVKP